MTLIAILDVMAACEREKVVIDPGSGPGKGRHGMAINAVGGKAACFVIRVGGGRIILLVAADAFHAKGSKNEDGWRCIYVTVVTIRGNVRADKRKTAFLVDLGDVVDDP